MRGMRPLRIPTALQIQRVPLGVVLVTLLASALAFGWAVLDGLPLYGIVGLAIAPWIPLFLFEALWDYQNYGFYALLFTFTSLQLGHMGEHTAQVVQLLVHEGDARQASGVFGRLDLELVHFVWDTGVWLGILGCIYFLGFRNKWMLISLVAASLHEVEHMFLIYLNKVDLDFYDAGGLAGVMAKSGLIGSPFSRQYLHFLYNALVVVPLVIAFWDESKRAFNVWLAKALPELTEAEKIAASAQLRRVTAKAGEAVIRQGDVADRFYVVSDGTLEVVHEAEGAERILATLGPGQFFGEIGLLAGRTRTATVRAKTDVDLLALDAPAFNDLVTRSQGGAARLTEEMRRRLGEMPTS
ncbi:MAG TPA: cyclic nucleotide-binding domain-containing protein [Gemmatimonadota bacterium]|nr:cyclic nucleotide-binding domain-containing protein [Gemmatimonadota bacterium]